MNLSKQQRQILEILAVQHAGLYGSQFRELGVRYWFRSSVYHDLAKLHDADLILAIADERRPGVLTRTKHFISSRGRALLELGAFKPDGETLSAAFVPMPFDDAHPLSIAAYAPCYFPEPRRFAAGELDTSSFTVHGGRMVEVEQPEPTQPASKFEWPDTEPQA